MRTVTKKDIDELERLQEEKFEHIKAMECIVAEIRSRYKDMTNTQLAEAIRDVRGMEQMISEERSWCDSAELRIKNFYTPATVVA